VFFLTFGGLSAFADPVVGGDQSSAVPSSATNVPPLNPEGEPIAVPMPGQLSQPPVITAGKSFVLRVKQKMRKLRSRVLYYRRATELWNQLSGQHTKPVSARQLAALSLPGLQKKALQWKRIANQARVVAQNPPHLTQFQCIHRFEGSWTDPDPPYFGGLQMDLGFQRTYAPRLLRTKGTADHWTPLEQIWTAEKAAKSRGFNPWPNTARSCGLL